MAPIDSRFEGAHFDPGVLSEIPDPFADVSNVPIPPRAAMSIAASPTRLRVRTLRLCAVASAVAFDALGVAVLRSRHDMGPVSLGFVLELAAPALAGAIAVAAVVRRGRLGLGETTERLGAMLAFAPAVFVLLTLPVAEADPDAATFWPRTAACFVTTLLLASGPLFFGVVAMRRAFASAAAWRTAAVGVASGALAAMSIALGCPYKGAFHILIGHGATMLFAGALGAWLGSRFARA
jgi:hypothetical protein